MQEPEVTVASVAHADGSDIHNGNVSYPERSPTADVSNSVESPITFGSADTKRPASLPVAAPADGAMPKAVDDVLHSDIGVNTLLNRLKQSIASARDLASFLKKRSSCEDDHAKELRRLCKGTMDSLRGRDSRQGSYASQFEEVIKLHDRMAENDVSFSLSLSQMSADLDTLVYDTERGRKQWKQTGLAAELKVQEAERMLEKAKQKYDSLAEDYDHAKTGDKSTGRHFGLRGPKSAAQHEEDLQRKLQTADQDYKNKVEIAQQLRKDLLDSSRPQAVLALKQLISECDSAVALQLQKFASFNEKLILGNGLLISPLNDGDSPRRSLRAIIAQVDNDKDFQNHILTFSSQVPGTKDIKYEQHPSLRPVQTIAPQTLKDPVSPQRAPQPQQSFTQPPSQFPMGQQAPSIPPQNYQTFEFPYDRKAQPPFPQEYPSGSPDRGFPPQQVQHQQSPYAPSPSAGAYGPAPPYGTAPLHGGGPLPPPGPVGAAQRPNSRGRGFPPPVRPVFKKSLQELFERDSTPVPSVVYQCIQAVELFGLDHEGIYRVSGNANHVAQLRAQFDNNSDTVDFRNPESFFHDVNVPANLLKQFFRELTDPVFTRAAYGEFLEAATVPDDIARRDRLHATINNLPDPNYATLRALTLHLHRVSQRVDQNRMSSNNLAMIFAPTLLGDHPGDRAIQEATLQTRVVETVLVNALQIFDED